MSILRFIVVDSVRMIENCLWNTSISVLNGHSIIVYFKKHVYTCTCRFLSNRRTEDNFGARIRNQRCRFSKITKIYFIRIDFNEAMNLFRLNLKIGHCRLAERAIISVNNLVIIIQGRKKSQKKTIEMNSG